MNASGFLNCDVLNGMAYCHFPLPVVVTVVNFNYANWFSVFVFHSHVRGKNHIFLSLSNSSQIENAKVQEKPHWMETESPIPDTMHSRILLFVSFLVK